MGKENKFYVGAHASIAKGFCNSLKSIDLIGGNAVQIFLKSPQGRASKPLDDKDAMDAFGFLKEKNMFLVGHCSYLLNFAKEFSDDPWAVESLIDDMKKIHRLGGAGVVLHIGKYVGMEKEIALENIKKSVGLVLEKTPKEVKVIFENTAGQGTEIGYRFEELSEIYNLFSKEEKMRIGFCLDTCHSFAAGYDLRNKEGVKEWQATFDKLIGWEKVVCIHFNDAKKELASRVDRHQDIGFGFIGNDGLKEVAIVAKETNKPLILETTTEHESYDKQIDTIKRWVK